MQESAHRAKMSAAVPGNFVWSLIFVYFKLS